MSEEWTRKKSSSLYLIRRILKYLAMARKAIEEAIEPEREEPSTESGYASTSETNLEKQVIVLDGINI